MSDKKQPKNNILKSFTSMFKGLFVKRKELSGLEEETLMSPSKVIVKKFFSSKLSILGLIIFAIMLSLTFIGSWAIDYDEKYNELSQINLAPGLDYLKYPKQLEKEGVKTISSGNSFSVALSDAGKLYVWGGNTKDVQKVPQSILDKADKIEMLSAGKNHVVAVINENGKQTLVGWGANDQHQAQMPVVDENTKLNEVAPGYVQIADYFKNVPSVYIYEDLIELPSVEISLNEELSTDTEFVIDYEGTDVNMLLTDIDFKITASPKGLYSGSAFRKEYSVKITLDPERNPEEHFKGQVIIDKSYMYIGTKPGTVPVPLDSTNIYQVVGAYEFQRSEGSKTTSYTDGLVINNTGSQLPDNYNVIEATKGLSFEQITVNLAGIETDPIAKVEAGNGFNSILTESGKLLTWGNTKSTGIYATIENDPTNPVVDFALNETSAMMLLKDGSLKFAGKTKGLDEGVTDDEKILVSNLLLPDAEKEGEIIKVSKVSLTLYNAVIVDENGKVYAWGDKLSGITNASTVLKDKKVIDVANGYKHVVFLTEDQEVYALGENHLKQTNVPKNLGDVDKIYADFFQNYVVTTDGEIVAFGNTGYLLGTDGSGRSLLQRIIVGGRVSMIVGAIAVVIQIIIGVAVGLIAGFYGGVIDNILMRLAEIISSFPFLPLAITLSALIGFSMTSTQKMYMIMVILGLLSWPGLARMIRGQILSEREKDFVLAAKALGIKEKNIIVKHILPSVINIVIVSATLSYAGSLLTEAGLSFLGFGVQKPRPSWGNLLEDAKSLTIIRNYWWQWILPALCIVITALSVNLIGDGLREAMDPKSNER